MHMDLARFQVAPTRIAPSVIRKELGALSILTWPNRQAVSASLKCGILGTVSGFCSLAPSSIIT